MKHALAVVIALALGPHLAAAHGVHVFAAAEGGAIQGYAYFSGGDPVRAAKIRIETASGDPLGSALTNDAGEFTFAVTQPVDHIFILDLPDGHNATYTVAASELGGTTAIEAEASPSPEAASDDLMDARIAEAVSREIAPLRKQIDAYQHSVRVHDIIGGIGYIVGILGFVFWFKGRRIARRD